MGQNGLVTFPLVRQESRPGLAHAHPVPPAMDCELEHTLTIGEGKASAAQPKGFPQLFPGAGAPAHLGRGYIPGIPPANFTDPPLLRTGKVHFPRPGGLGSFQKLGGG